MEPLQVVESNTDRERPSREVKMTRGTLFFCLLVGIWGEGELLLTNGRLESGFRALTQVIHLV